MIQAYVLVQTEVGHATEVATAVAALEGVDSASEVTGPYDLIARIAADDLDGLGSFVVDRIQVVPGITRTLTCTIVHG